MKQRNKINETAPLLGDRRPAWDEFVQENLHRRAIAWPNTQDEADELSLKLIGDYIKQHGTVYLGVEGTLDDGGMTTTNRFSLVEPELEYVPRGIIRLKEGQGKLLELTSGATHENQWGKTLRVQTHGNETKDPNALYLPSTVSTKQLESITQNILHDTTKRIEIYQLEHIPNYTRKGGDTYDIN